MGAFCEVSMADFGDGASEGAGVGWGDGVGALGAVGGGGGGGDRLGGHGWGGR